MALGFNRYIRVILPKSGQKVRAGTQLRISWDAGSFFVSFKVYYRLSPKQNWVFIVEEDKENFILWNVPSNISSQQAQIKVEGIAPPNSSPNEQYFAVSEPFVIYQGTLISLPYPNIIHGYGKPVIEIYDSNNNLQYELALKKTIAITETWTPEIITHKLYNGRKRYIAKGWWYSAELDFSEYAPAEVLLTLQPLFDLRDRYLTEKRTILLYPRGNIFEYGGNINYFYKVEIDNESEFTMQQTQHHTGYRGMKLILRGTERLLRPFEPITYLQTEEMNKVLPYGIETGYGEDYGENYGENL